MPGIILSGHRLVAPASVTIGIIRIRPHVFRCAVNIRRGGIPIIEASRTIKGLTAATDQRGGIEAKETDHYRHSHMLTSQHNWYTTGGPHHAVH